LRHNIRENADVVKTYPVPCQLEKRLVDGYKAMYAESVKTPAKFWAKHAKRLDWFKALPKSRTHPLPMIMFRSSGLRMGFSIFPTIALTGI
jgi:hypothetical protein